MRHRTESSVRRWDANVEATRSARAGGTHLLMSTTRRRDRPRCPALPSTRYFRDREEEHGPSALRADERRSSPDGLDAEVEVLEAVETAEEEQVD
jgi:hypothetical protein